jgi:hypothetical protein
MTPDELRDVENRLWSAADQMWANTGWMPSEYSAPVLGLIFLRYAEQRFAEVEKELNPGGSGRRTITAKTYQSKGVVWLGNPQTNGLVAPARGYPHCSKPTESRKRLSCG